MQPTFSDLRHKRDILVPKAPFGTHAEHYHAIHVLVPGLMATRVQSWGQEGHEIDPQPDSLFYNGRISQEITDMIFEYALSPDFIASSDPRMLEDDDKDHDFCVRHDHKPSSDEPEVQLTPAKGDEAVGELAGASTSPSVQNHISRSRAEGFDWYRPDVAAKKFFPGKGLLHTCRQVYLDANHFLARQHEATIWQGREPWGGQVYDRFARNIRENPEKSQLQPISSIRMYAQMWMLESIAAGMNNTPGFNRVDENNPESAGSYWHLRSLLSNGQGPTHPVWRVLHNLQEFHLILRRTDWDRWEDNKALAIDVFRAGFAAPDVGVMRKHMHAAAEGREQPPFEDGSLGTMFRVMANLKKLTISFETSEDKKDEMEDIANWARTWRFDVMSWRHWMIKGNREVMAHLVCDDGPARKSSWRGLPHHWSDVCPSCTAHFDDDCPYCQKREKLLKDGKGPRLLVWTLTWRPRLVEPPVSLADTEERAPYHQWRDRGQASAGGA